MLLIHLPFFFERIEFIHIKLPFINISPFCCWAIYPLIYLNNTNSNCMGLFQTLSSLFNASGKQVEILVIGLDNSGKTTVLNQLKPPEAQSSSIVPTVGYTVDKFSAGGLLFTAYDMSGQSRYRNLWETQYKNVHGIIFVVDSTDKLRIAVARDELWMLLDHKDLTYKKTPILVLANKADLKDAVPSGEIHNSLGLDLIRNRSWHIATTCALTGQGLVEAVDWLASTIKQQFAPSSP